MQNIERKYRKPVNANGWMRRFQKWTWGKATPNFVGYCPFFWFTWLCVLIFPVSLIFKLIRLAFRFIGSGVPEHFFVSRPPPAKLVEFWEDVLRNGLELTKATENTSGGLYYKAVLDWLAVTPDWEKCVLRAYANSLKRKEKAAIRAPKQAAFARRMSAFANYFVKPLLCLIAGGATLFVCKGLWTLFRGVTWEIFLSATKFTGWLVVGTLVLYVFNTTVTRFIQGLRKCPKCPGKITWSYRAGLLFIGVVDFLGDTVSYIYTRECPLIEWDNHDEPIQPRE